MSTVYTNQRAMMVKNLRPGLTECGKIKIGKKGNVVQSQKGKEFQPPQKLDHFVVTTLQRGRDGNFQRDEEVHRMLGEKPQEIPVRLLFNDPWLNFQTVYTAFQGAKRWCVGDGETAQRMGVESSVECPCERLDPAYTGQDKCKINGTLSVVIEGASVVGGVWKLRTTSINTCQGIASSLALLASVTGGQLAGVPLTLAIRPKAATTPQGQQTTVYVVGLEFRGTVEQLRDHAYKMALADGTHGQRMQQVEAQARALIEAPQVASEDLDAVEEFYPENAAASHGATLSPPTPETPAAPEIPDPAADTPTTVEFYDHNGMEHAGVAQSEADKAIRTLLAVCETHDDVAKLIKANEGNPAFHDKLLEEARILYTQKRAAVDPDFAKKKGLAVDEIGKRAVEMADGALRALEGER